MIDLSVRRPIATAALYVGLLALGAYSFRLIPVELLPDVSYPRLTVSASWSGASPELMESRVTVLLESAAQQVEGVREVRSVSRLQSRGAGSEAEVTIEFAREARMEFAELELRERLAALREELPPGVRPTVTPYVPEEFAEENEALLSYRMRGPYTPSRLAELAREEIRPVLIAVDGVSDVRLRGGEERAVSVVLDRDRLDAFDLGAFEVQDRLRTFTEVRAPGSVALEGREVSLAVRTRAESVEELREAVVAHRPAGAVRLADVARVRDGTADPTGYRRIDGQPAITLTVHRQAGTNAVRLADAIEEEMETVRAGLPPEVGVELESDRSEDIEAQLSDLRLRAIAAAAVIFLVLTLFLRSLGGVLVVFATIAFSVLIAVNFLYLGGFSLNVLTLAGLAWGFGLVVDNGIVVLENVERRREAGDDPETAAREGARQVWLPVVAATATTAIVLVPFLMLQGELRLYYVPLGWAVGFSILASLFVAFTFVPTMAARLPGAGKGAWEGERGGKDSAGVGRGSAGGDAAGGGRGSENDEGDGDGRRGGSGGEPDGPPPLYERVYRAVIGWSLDHPAVVAVLCAACLGGSWWVFDRHVTRGVEWSSFFGQRTYIAVTIQYPEGAGLERTDALAREFESELAGIPAVDRFETTVSPDYAYIRVTFPDALETTQVPVAIKERMVAYSHGFSGVDVRVYGYGPSFYGGGGSAPNYAVDVFGFNYLRVREIAEELARNLQGFSRIRDVDPNASGRFFQRDEAFEFTVRPDRAALASTGLTVRELLDFVALNVRGETTVGRNLRLGGGEVPYSVKLSGYREFDVTALEDLRVPVAGEGGGSSAGGQEVRLGDVAGVRERKVLGRVERENQEYRRSVAWEFRGPRKLGDVVRDAVLEQMELPPGYRIEAEDRFRWSEEEERQVWWAVAFAVALVFMVTAALFESLAAPLVVLLTLPLALIGVFLVFFYTGATFTRTAYIGAIMMGGIVVNNAILIVYHVGELRERLPDREAILLGTLERVRPILMTTATTVLGLLPLVLFAGSQDENIWNALALATIGGLLSSTLFVLLAIPAAYQVLVVRGRAGVQGTVG